MVKITYRERIFLDRFRCIEYKKEFKAWSYFQSGGLYYFKVDRFNHKVLAIEDTISIEEM